MEEILKQLLMQRSSAGLTKAAQDTDAFQQQLAMRQRAEPAPQLDHTVRVAKRLMLANRNMSPEDAMRQARAATNEAATTHVDYRDLPVKMRQTLDYRTIPGPTIRMTESRTGQPFSWEQKPMGATLDDNRFGGLGQGVADESYLGTARNALSVDELGRLGSDLKNAAGAYGEPMTRSIPMPAAPRTPVVIPADPSPVGEQSTPAGYLIDPSPGSRRERDELNKVLADRIAGGASDFWQLQGLAPWSMAGVMSKLPESLQDQELEAIDMGSARIGRPHEPASLIGGSGDDNRDKLSYPRAKGPPSLRIRGGQNQVMPEYGSMEAATGEPDPAYMAAMEDVLRQLGVGATRY